MKSAIAVRDTLSDQAKIQRVVEVLKGAGGGPLMVRQIAEAMPASPNTAGKYVDICAERGLVEVTPYATTKQVRLATSTRNGGAGVR